MRPAARVALVAILSGAMSLACTGGGQTAGPAATVAIRPTAATTVVPPTTTATVVSTSGPDLSATELCPAGVGYGCRLSAGEHTSTAFGGGITFTLTKEWIVQGNESDVIALAAGPLVSSPVLEFISGSPRILDGQLKPIKDAATAKQAIDAISGLAVTNRPAEPILGLTGVVFDVSTNDGTDTVEHEVLWYPVTENKYVLSSGRILRLMWFSVGGAPFIIAIESRESDFEALLATARPIIASLKLG